MHSEYITNISNEYITNEYITNEYITNISDGILASCSQHRTSAYDGSTSPWFPWRNIIQRTLQQSRLMNALQESICYTSLTRFLTFLLGKTNNNTMNIIACVCVCGGLKRWTEGWRESIREWKGRAWKNARRCGKLQQPTNLIRFWRTDGGRPTPLLLIIGPVWDYDWNLITQGKLSSLPQHHMMKVNSLYTFYSVCKILFLFLHLSGEPLTITSCMSIHVTLFFFHGNRLFP